MNAYALFEVSDGLQFVSSFPTYADAEAHAERVARQYLAPLFEVVAVPIPESRGQFGREG